MTVMDPGDDDRSGWDGATMARIMFRGNITMKATSKNRRHREGGLCRAGWFHSGNLAVMQDDGYVKIGPLQDVIISGGENISSLGKSRTRCYRHRRAGGRRV